MPVRFQPAVFPPDVQRHASTALRVEVAERRQPAEAGGFGFFEERRGHIEAGAKRQPRAPSRDGLGEHRHARAEKRAEVAVDVEPSAHRRAEPRHRRVVVLREQCSRGVAVVEGREIRVAVAVLLDRRSGDPGVSAAAAVQCAFGEPRIVGVVLEAVPEALPVRHQQARGPEGEHPRRSPRQSGDDAGVDAPGVQRLLERASIRSDGPFGRPALAVFEQAADGEEHRSAGAVLPEQPRPRGHALIRRDIRPTVAVHILRRLEVAAAEEGVAPLGRQAARQPQRAIGAAAAGPIHEQLALGPIRDRPPRHQIDHAAERRRAIQR